MVLLMNSFFEAFDLFEVITRSFATTSGHIFSTSASLLRWNLLEQLVYPYLLAGVVEQCNLGVVYLVVAVDDFYH